MNTDVQQFEACGRAAATLLLPAPPNWIHRRVQSLRYLDSSWTEIRLSIDFDAPATAGLPWVPITMLPKWPPLFRVDFRGSDGQPVALLTSDENGAADFGLMAGLADAIDPILMEDATFAGALSVLTRGPETELDKPFIELHNTISSHHDLSDPQVSRFVDLAANLTTSTMLWYPIDPQRLGARTIAKVAYHWPDRNTDNTLVRALRSLSWYHPTEWMPLPHIGGEANFHLEIEAPPPLIIKSIEPPLFWQIVPEEGALLTQASDGAADIEADAAERRPSADDAVDRDSPEAGAAGGEAMADPVNPIPEQYVDRHANLAHAYVSGSRPGTADIEFRLAPPRAGFVGAAFVASVLIAAFVSAMNMYRGYAALADNRDAAIALLAIVPAVIGYLVVRPTDLAIVRRHVMGVQIVAGCASVVPVVMGVLLIRYSDAPHCLRVSWRAAVIASWAFAAMLLVSVLRSGASRATEADH